MLDCYGHYRKKYPPERLVDDVVLRKRFRDEFRDAVKATSSTTLSTDRFAERRFAAATARVALLHSIAIEAAEIESTKNQRPKLKLT